MEIELVPEPGPADPAARAAVVALTREGISRDERPPGADGAWRRAGVDEAVDRNQMRNGGAPDTTPPTR